VIACSRRVMSCCSGKTTDERALRRLILDTYRTSEHEGGAYVQTANLDGETDLKPRTALAATQVRKHALGNFCDRSTLGTGSRRCCEFHWSH
jgi:hypothetical protein